MSFLRASSGSSYQQIVLYRAPVFSQLTSAAHTFPPPVTCGNVTVLQSGIYSTPRANKAFFLPISGDLGHVGKSGKDTRIGGLVMVRGSQSGVSTGVLSTPDSHGKQSTFPSLQAASPLLSGAGIIPASARPQLQGVLRIASRLFGCL